VAVLVDLTVRVAVDPVDPAALVVAARLLMTNN
jgi:hypothetical protein